MTRVSLPYEGKLKVVIRIDGDGLFEEVMKDISQQAGPICTAKELQLRSADVHEHMHLNISFWMDFFN